MIRRLLALVPLLLLLAAAPPPGADCSADVSPLQFGQFRSIGGGGTDITATIVVTCTATLAATIAYEIRIAPAPGGAGRVMHGAAGDLRYDLYTSPAYRQPWGDGTGGTSVVEGSMALAAGERHSASYTVYGRILADRRVRAGSYADAPAVYLVVQ